MRITDASFVSYKNVPILETGSPNKYFDGLAAGKLIITNFGGWIRKDIEENRCGFYCDPREPVDFIKKITPFLEDPKLLKQYQQAARTLAEKNYSRVLLSDKWLKLIEASRPGN
jgi:glycosyltransferase involved in cell wall biosynthesis